MFIFYFLLLDYQEKVDEWSLKALYYFNISHTNNICHIILKQIHYFYKNG